MSAITSTTGVRASRATPAAVDLGRWICRPDLSTVAGVRRYKRHTRYLEVAIVACTVAVVVACLFPIS